MNENKGQATLMFRLLYRSVPRALIAACLLALLGAARGNADSAPVTVFAAASLMSALNDVVARYEDETGEDITLSLAGSSTLAQQIRRGAPADIFISANGAWMDRIEAEGLIAQSQRFDLLGNRLVLIGAAGHGAVTLGPELDLKALLGGGRLALALIDAVPAGIYGKAALEHFGLWRGIAPHVAQTDNVRAALALVATGAAPLGITYATDARADPRVRILATFPADAHPAITYPAAALNTGAETLAFLAYLRAPVARSIFETHGFIVPEQ
ncbi:molybdate ABC transporter substrate-binding protein [Litorivita sp. NS0012-18]|uniref:molybdate ABC transporter substrate-binding protein n=1 Tax=Litorivita sp. NS0012-18 TaxID=3127655 RepID=UPI0033413B36